MKAIERTATLKDKNQLILDKPVHLQTNGKVKLIILFPEESEIDETEWLSAAMKNPAFDFLKDPKEDIYTDADGFPFED